VEKPGVFYAKVRQVAGMDFKPLMGTH